MDPVTNSTPLLAHSVDPYLSSTLPSLHACESDDLSDNANCTDYPLHTPLYIKVYVGILYGSVFTLGVAGNLLVIFVVLRVKEMRTSTNYCLINLSFADLAALCVCLPSAMLDFYMEEEWVLGDVMCRFVYFLENMTINTTMLTILAISLERYFAICHPLRNYSMFSSSRVTKVILSVWFLGAILSCPFMWVSQQEYTRFHDGRRGYVCASHFDKTWRLVYMYVMFACVFIMPLLLLPIFYVKIIWTLVTHNLQGSADSRKNCASLRSKKQVIYILATVIIMFYVCVIPIRVFSLWLILASEEDHSQLPFEHYLNIMHIVRLLTYVNSAGNPIVYNVISTKFRAASMSVFRGSRGGPKRGTACSSFHPYSHHTHNVSGSLVNRSPAGSLGRPTMMFAMKARNGAGGTGTDPVGVRGVGGGGGGGTGGGGPAGSGGGGSGSGSGNCPGGIIMVVESEAGRGVGFHGGNNSTCTTWFQYSVDMNSVYESDGAKMSSTML